MRKLLIVLLMPLVVFATPTNLSVIKIAWDEVTKTPLGLPFIADGYKVYCGSSPSNYSTMIDVGKATEYVLDSKMAEGINYCAVTVYNGTDESNYSEEVIFKTTMGKYERIGLVVPNIRLE